MAFRYLLLVLPALVHCIFRVHYHATLKYGYYYSYNISGRQVDIISRLERYAFGLSDHNLKNGVRAYFGRLPDDAFLRSPTPWGDLYKIYNWTQVKRTVALETFNLLSAIIQSTTTTRAFENTEIQTANSNKPPLSFNVGMSKSVANKVSSTWQINKILTVPQDVSHDISIADEQFKKPIAFRFTSGWGVEKNISSKAMTIGNSSITILLLPGQAVTSTLHATKIIIRFELVYVANLSGAVAVNYDEIYKCHHHWSLPIRDVMKHGRLTNEVVTREIIEVSYYRKDSVIVRDKKNKKVLLKVPYTPVPEPT